MCTDRDTNKKIVIAIDGFFIMRQIDLRQGHRPPSGIYFHRYGGDVPRRDALCARNTGPSVREWSTREAVVRLLPDICIDFRFNPERGGQRHLCRRRPRRGRIRTIEVSNCVSAVSSICEVRAKLVAMQQQMGRRRGVVMDGRDIGTTVFPDAELKNLHDGPAFGAGAPPLRRAAGQRRRSLLRGDSAKTSSRATRPT